MQNIEAQRQSIREVLQSKKYKIDYYQREYRWEKKHIEQLIDDLYSKFDSEFKEGDDRQKVKDYNYYYLGSIVLSDNGGNSNIIDGQQRLTSITLLLIYLKNLSSQLNLTITNIDNLIFSEMYGQKSFNIHIDDRIDFMKKIYENGDFELNDVKSESIMNLSNRYGDITELFPIELKNERLPYFIDWLIDNVVFVRIITPTELDAYIIFETMNNRGLNLTPTEMLKNFLFAQLDENIKEDINKIWKEKISKLKEINKDEDLEFFKNWLRAKYAKTYRLRKKGAENKDFEIVATIFHDWIRNNAKKTLKLNNKDDFYKFIKDDFSYFADLYMKIKKFEKVLTENQEFIYYINKRFTLQYPLLLASVNRDDNDETVFKKLKLISRFIETYIVYRIVNSKSLTYNTIRDFVFRTTLDIRNKRINELASILKEKLSEIGYNFETISELKLNQQNKQSIHYLLARITQYIERESEQVDNIQNYLNEKKNKYEIEHIWANKFSYFKDEFDQEINFNEFRNKIGGLILLPKRKNQSYGDEKYEVKLNYYFSENLLAKSLNQKCYEKNPGFLKYKQRSNLPFKHYEHFTKDSFIEREELYQKICEEIWSLSFFDSYMF